MHTISLINMKGGVAKTTLSINIADCLSRRHEANVLLIDVDPQFNATQCLMAAQTYVEHIQNQRDTIINVFDRNYRPTIGIVDEPTAIAPRNLTDIEPFEIRNNFHLLPGALDLYRLEMAPGEGRENRLRRYLHEIENQFDYVIIDTPPTPSVWMTSALLASSFYLIPVKPDPISLTGIDLLHGIIAEKTENFGLSIECVGLVLTMVEENTIVYRQAKQNLEGNARWRDKVLTKYLPKRTEIARQQLNQQFILDSSDAQAKASLVGIVNEVIGRIG